MSEDPPRSVWTRTWTYLAVAHGPLDGTAEQSQLPIGAAGEQAVSPVAVPHTCVTVVALSFAFALELLVAVPSAVEVPAQVVVPQSMATASAAESAPFCSWRRSEYSDPTSTTIAPKPS